MKIKILSIGNSFGQDAIRYLSDIAKADGNKIDVVNMYIGGCPLSRHHENMVSGKRAYTLEFNGQSTGCKFAMEDAFLARKWDYVTFHQASAYSDKYENYIPFLPEISARARELAPTAKQYLYETWAYEDGSEKLASMGYEKRIDMYTAVRSCYLRANEEIGFEGYIPAGALFQRLIEKGVIRLHRDGFHASYGIGRYALGLLWYQTFSGLDITENTFADFDEPIDGDTVRVIKETVKEFCSGR